MSLCQISFPKTGREAGELLVVGAFSREPVKLASRLEAQQKSLRSLQKSAKFTGEKETFLASGPLGKPIAEAVVVGLGGSKEFDEEGLLGFVDSAVAAAGRRGARRLLLCLPSHKVTRGKGAERVLRQLLLVNYRFDRFKKHPEKKSELKVGLLVEPAAEERYRGALRGAKAAAAGIAFARDLGNTPPNVAHPEWMAAEARALAKEFGMKCRVLGPRQLARKGMNGILAVGTGAANGPRLVRLELGSGKKVISLVGKGVTFDSGGISIKPSAGMDEMKYDKCGACTVLGVMKALAVRQPKCRVRAYLPLAENMPDGLAYRPGDIVEMYGGKSVEVKNTDAEGRMILADAMSWAVEEKPDHLVELSTLTGATVVALGQEAAALYTEDDSLAKGLLKTATDQGEGLWRMPLWKAFKDKVKGTHADLQNTGGRWGGANTAAAFLWSFVEEHPSWAHVDIAGTAWVGPGDGDNEGATGYGVAFLSDWVHSMGADL